jgi:hypothetical protein
MKRIILLSLAHTVLFASMPAMANELNSQPVSPNFEGSKNLPISQSRPTYQRGYTVHYRNSRSRQWTLEGFHAERRDAERAAVRLQRSGFRTQIRSRAAAERRKTGGY